ncbi:MAG: sodium-translocating pyrophosphatase [Planctomycetes bacterium]|nr:sodium-translocating pyrophosphatase [Planctomycetota bacterium]
MLDAQDQPAADVAIEKAATVTEAATGHATAAARSLSDLPQIWWIAPIAAVISLFMAFYFYKSIMKASEGNDRMKEIAQYVRDGAYAYLRRQYKVVAVFFVVVCVALIIVAFKFEAQHRLVPFAFLTGGFFSGLAGFFGMKTATNASARTAQGASESLNRGLQIAFRAGAVMGLTVVGLGLLDICGWFIYLYRFHHVLFGGEAMTLEMITVVMLCFGMGASSQALFARVGGGIYTKAADVGADLVGKVEAGIPEDDPRNPATIADNVGDNVGDVAGMGADLYESYCGSILATAALGVAAMIATGEKVALSFLAAPMVLAGIGIILSIIGVFLVRTKEGATMKNLLWALNKGVWGSSILIIIAAFFVCKHMLGGYYLGVFGSICTGLIAGILIGQATEYYTASEYKPTQRVADAANTGPATVAIAGLAEGMLSTWIPILVVGIAMMAAFTFCNGWNNLTFGLYGVGIAAVGMLSTLGITLATDAYGPIADNAGGNAEMSGLGPKVRERTDALDSLGNTTAATGKGFAIGSAALTALALLAAYVEEVRVGIHREVSAEYVAPAAAGEMTFSCVNPQTGTSRYKAALYVAPEAGTQVTDLHSKELLTISLMYAAGSSRTMAIPADIAMPEGLPRDGWVPVQVGEHLIDNAAVWKKLGLVATDEMKAAYTKKAGLEDFMTFYNVTPMNPKFLVGVFFGVLLVFVFSSMTMKAVGRAAMAMVNEVRRQFREIPGIMEGTGKPDYASCVSISTAGAQREMVLPSLLALVVPIAVGLVLGVSGVMGLLVGGLCCGFAVAVFMANAGGAWDNAKKYIETGKHGGKGSDAHKAAVTGDTIGDPFKDTSGPSLNILIKLMSMVSVVFAGFVVKAAPYISGWLESLGG